MGQSAYAIMFGVKQPDDFDYYGEDREDGSDGLYDLACARWKAEIAAINAARKPGWEEPDGEDMYIPAVPYEADPPLLGFYIAIGGSGRAGAADLIGFPIDDIAATYGEEIASAKERWERFAAFAAGQGVELAEARLWMTWAETA